MTPSIISSYLRKIRKMKSKKIVALCLLLFIPLLAMAKKETVKYVVSDVQGRVEMVTAKGKQRLSKGDVVLADATLNVPFNGSISLMAEDGDKQYVINSPGKAKVESFLADKRNTVLTLTKDYVKSVVAQLRKDKSVKARRHSDPATVTREVINKDTLVMDSLVVVKEDSTCTQP